MDTKLFLSIACIFDSPNNYLKKALIQKYYSIKLMEKLHTQNYAEKKLAW